MSDQAEPKTTYEPRTSGKCPHCQYNVTFDPPETEGIPRHMYQGKFTTSSGGDEVHSYSSKCPRCGKPVVAAKIKIGEETTIRLVHPFGAVRAAPEEVPKHIREDFKEAAAVLQLSEKASAALSRRCLQSVLLDQGAPKGDLVDQIGWAVEKLNLRSEIVESLDHVRVVGNFAAHPEKSKSTGEIVDVEPEEANWNLDVLESLFQSCYVVPNEAKRNMDKLKQKLTKAGLEGKIRAPVNNSMKPTKRK